MLFNERDVVVRSYYNAALTAEAERRRALQGNSFQLRRINNLMLSLRHGLRSLWMVASQHGKLMPQQPAH